MVVGAPVALQVAAVFRVIYKRDTSEGLLIVYVHMCVAAVECETCI